MSEQLNYQQLKNIKQVAKVCGMDDMGTIENSTGTFSIDGSKISGDISGNAAGITGSITAANLSLSTADTLDCNILGNAAGITGSITAANLSLSTADTLDCNISGNAAFASAAEAGSALETTLNEKLDAANAVTHTATVYYYMQQIYTAQQNIQVFAGHGLMVGDIIVNTTGFEDGTKVSAITENSLGYSIISLNKNWIPNVLSNSINVIGIRGKAVFNSINDNKMGALALTSYQTLSGNDMTTFHSYYAYLNGHGINSNQNWSTNVSGSGTITSVATYWNNWSLRCSQGICAKSILLGRDAASHSDARIKMNIEDVPDTLALDQVRQIPCRYYEYTDKVNRGAGKTIGFIAQEVKEVLPMAVKTTVEFIPDHMRAAEVSWEEMDGKHLMTVSNLDADVASGTKVKFVVVTGTPPEMNEDGSVKTPASDDFSECEKQAVMRDDGKFEMDNVYDAVFIIGREVDDFLAINKAKIFALHHSAIQELDRTVETQKTTISNLQSTVESQQAVLNTLLARVAVLEG